ncbi:MAG: hypothetical protein DRP03_03105 [Candidatus Aenigmatarchaeota archaeon]|nr:MAG: hypothetical protein DRP03_03105 [Candidatus Aenigmarchaeota archaeon]
MIRFKKREDFLEEVVEYWGNELGRYVFGKAGEIAGSLLDLLGLSPIAEGIENARYKSRLRTSEIEGPYYSPQIEEEDYLSSVENIIEGKSEVPVSYLPERAIKRYVKEKIRDENSSVLGAYIAGFILLADELPTSITGRLKRYNRQREREGYEPLTEEDLYNYIKVHELTHHLSPDASEKEVEVKTLKALEKLAKKHGGKFKRAWEAGLFLDSLEYTAKSTIAREVAKYYKPIKEFADKLKGYLKLEEVN